MLTVPILIPVLTNFPLPLSDMGDILGGGLILTLGSFMITLAGLDSGSAYGGIGSSRAVMVAILAEPTLILVFVGITLARQGDAALRRQSSAGRGARDLLEPDASLPGRRLLRPAAGRDRPPADPFLSTHIEVYMIDEARILEYSGPLLAILRWASMMKQFILYTIFCNVLLLPWGLSREGTALGVVGSVDGADRSSSCLVACVVVVVETAQSRLRFYRYQEPLAASFLLRDPRDRRNATELKIMLVAHLDPLAAVALQPDGDRQPAAVLRHARLALAQATISMPLPPNPG